MIYKVLSWIGRILFPLMTILFIVCIVYTFSSSAVREGIDNVTEAIDNAVSEATEAMETSSWIDYFRGLFGGESSSSSTEVQEAAAFYDTEEGQAYLTWKNTVDEPVYTIFAGTDVTADVLEGVAGGASSAISILTDLDETALIAIDANARNYAATLSAATPSSLLSADIRARMLDAQTYGGSFASAVEAMVSDIREVKRGTWGASSELESSANDAVVNLQYLDTALQEIEEILVG